MNDNNDRPSWQTPAAPDYSYGTGQPGPYTVPPVAVVPPPRKPKRTGWKIFGGLVAFLVGLVIVSGIIGTATDPGKTAQLPTEVTSKAGAPKVTVPPAAKKWVPLATVTGGTEKTSDTIRTVGGKVRITWTFTGGEYAAGAIYLLNEGTDLQTDGGVPVAMIDEASTKDSIVLRKAPGEYFVQVTAANAKYTVKVEEER